MRASPPTPREEPTVLRLGIRRFGPGDYAIMAIVNRTPDSFFDRGATFAADAALRAVDVAVADGADIIDIGGVKAGPGAFVDGGGELWRTVPIIAAGGQPFPGVVVLGDPLDRESTRFNS